MFKTPGKILLSLFIGTVASVAVENPPAAPTTATAPAQPNPTGAHAQFATPVYDFGRAQAGELVKYSFIFTNVGDQALEVTAVQPSCGCTTAGDWTHRVEPGQTGTISVQFNSANFNGPVFKTINVTSNDKQRPVNVLQLKGTVWKPIDVVPQYTVINVPPDSNSASASIKILNHGNDPLMVFSPECTPKSFSVTLTTNTSGQEYTVALKSAIELNIGNIQGKITLKTSSTKTPNLDLPFWVNVQPSVTVSPPRISLAQTPLNAKSPVTLTIQNNTTNTLTVSDGRVNIPGVDVELKEVQPGRMFSAVVTFPEGYNPPVGQPVEVKFKSNQPRMPEIKVPVLSFPRPMASAAPAVPQPLIPRPGVSNAPVTPVAAPVIR
jgi:hypothetical protein